MPTPAPAAAPPRAAVPTPAPDARPPPPDATAAGKATAAATGNASASGAASPSSAAAAAPRAAGDAAGTAASAAAGKAAQPAAAKPAAVAKPAGLVTFAVTPWGEIHVDGRLRGIAPPLQELRVSPGRHAIEIRNPTFPAHRETIDVPADGVVRIRHKFP
jgi:hypothetical protein